MALQTAKYVTLKALRADRGFPLRFKRLMVYDTKIISTLWTGAGKVFGHRWDGIFPLPNEGCQWSQDAIKRRFK